MKTKLHPLVQKTKIELQKLDENNEITWGERKSYKGSNLPISVEPKLRVKALRFMNDLINLLEANGHGIKFEYDRCNIIMYGQLTEINLRQKYYRKRIKGTHGFSHNTFIKSDDLEFQVGSYARKSWIDNETKTLEDFLPAIYTYIEKDSKEWAELRERQHIQKEKDKIHEQLEAERAELIAIENTKLDKLITDADNYKKASKIRSYLKALEEKINQTDNLNNAKNKEYIEWAYNKANEIDPINNITKE